MAHYWYFDIDEDFRFLAHVRNMKKVFPIKRIVGKSNFNEGLKNINKSYRNRGYSNFWNEYAIYFIE